MKRLIMSLLIAVVVIGAGCSPDNNIEENSQWDPERNVTPSNLQQENTDIEALEQ